MFPARGIREGSVVEGEPFTTDVRGAREARGSPRDERGEGWWSGQPPAKGDVDGDVDGMAAVVQHRTGDLGPEFRSIDPRQPQLCWRLPRSRHLGDRVATAGFPRDQCVHRNGTAIDPSATRDRGVSGAQSVSHLGDHRTGASSPDCGGGVLPPLATVTAGDASGTAL